MHGSSARKPDVPSIKGADSKKEKDATDAVFKAPLSAVSPNQPRPVDNTSKVPLQPANKVTPKQASPSMKSRIPVQQREASSKAIDSNAGARKPQAAVTAPSPAKKAARKDIKIFKDPVPASTATSNITARGLNSTQKPVDSPLQSPSASSTKPGLRPLLLRADSAQGLRAPAKSFIDGNPLMSTPTKKFGQVANAWAASANNNNNSNNGNTSASSTRVLDSAASNRTTTTTPRKSVTMNRVSSVAQTRDSKELRSPESIKTQKSGLLNDQEVDKENIRTSPLRPTTAEKNSPKHSRGFFKSKSGLAACEYSHIASSSFVY